MSSQADFSNVGAIETAECFDKRICAEVVRRGLKRSVKVIILADGAKWIWVIFLPTNSSHAPSA